MTVSLNNNFFKSPYFDEVARYKFSISNNLGHINDTITYTTKMQPSEAILVFSSSDFEFRIIMNNFIVSYDIIKNTYTYQISVSINTLNKFTLKQEITPLYDTTFTVFDNANTLWILNAVNAEIITALYTCKLPNTTTINKLIDNKDNLSSICFLIDYLIVLSWIQFPRNGNNV